NLAAWPPHHQLGVYASYLLGDESILSHSLRVVLVSKADRPQLHQAGAGAPHVANVALVARRRSHDTQLSRGVNHHCASIHATAADACDECPGLRALRANADGVGLGGDASVADIDIILSRGEIESGIDAEADIVLATRVFVQGVKADSGV